MRQIILDTETTGLEPALGHRIIELAGLEMVHRKLTGRQLHCYFHPERAIDAEAEKVHGISLEFLANQPFFRQKGAEVADFLRDAELIIHNAPFDIGFLNAEFERLERPKISSLCRGVIDTLSLAREQFPGKRNHLDALCDRFEISRKNRTLHGALIDCELLAEVYLAMTRGQEHLEIEVTLDRPSLSVNAAATIERLPLPILYANADEITAHEQYMAGLQNHH